MLVQPFQVRKQFADTLLEYLEEISEKANQYAANKPLVKEMIPDLQKLPDQPVALSLSAGDRRYKLAHELFPLVDDYHRHMKKAAIAQDFKKRINSRRIQLELENASWVKRREILVDIIENLILEKILKTMAFIKSEIEGAKTHELLLDAKTLREVKENLINRSNKSYDEFHKILISFLDNTINFPNEVLHHEKKETRNFRQDRVNQRRDEITRVMVETRSEKQYEDIRLLLANFEVSARYVTKTTFYNPTEIYLKSPKSGQQDKAVKRVMGIKYKKG